MLDIVGLMPVDRLDRERRLEAIAFAEPELLVDLADEVLANLDLTVTRGPTVGLLAVRVEEPFERLSFNFTEVTVSEAEVSAGGSRGYAMVLGRQPAKALAGAVLDAALELGHGASGRSKRCSGRRSTPRQRASIANGRGSRPPESPSRR